MTLGLKLHKSAGVPVTAAVHGLLSEANGARDRREWAAAAAGYRKALERDATLFHIWIQLGHALKELEQYDQAEAAYQHAIDLQPHRAEPHLHLGHAKKRQGQGASANQHYVQAARLEPNHPDVLGELQSLSEQWSEGNAQEMLLVLQSAMDDPEAWEPRGGLQRVAEHAQASIKDLLGALQLERKGSSETSEALAAALALVEGIGQDSADDIEASAVNDAGPALVFDVSDLISYFRNARLPTGIQRVQIETICSALQDAKGRSIQVCCFQEQRDEWLEIPPAAFLSLCRLSLVDGDRTAPQWTMALRRLQMTLSMAPALVFPQGAFLINLGTSWWLQNYFLFVRKAKAEHGIRYVPFIHDFIPVMASEHCTRELTQDFISWAIGAFEHADFFLVNSQATKRDLVAVADLLGHPVTDDRICIVRLDADFRKKPAQAPADPSVLRTWGLERTPFVLFVSTIESRKNHLCAFKAWTQLIHAHGARKTPKLVCVGNRGWLNDAVYAQLEGNAVLRERVLMLSGLSDAELALLYQRCLFTLYPSQYEGWGLPVTESLCYGKTPVVSDASSLPEAGGDFAVYFESGSSARLAEALDRLIHDAAHRADRERRIAQDFRPRSWAAIAEQIADQASAWGAAPPSAHAAPQARLGAYYPIVRNFETRLWAGMRSAEIFRAGAGWWGPDDWGCWTKAQGGELEIGLPARHGAVRGFVRLHGLPGKDATYRLKVGHRPSIEGFLRAGEFKWASFDLPATGGGQPILRIRLESEDTADLASVTNGMDRRVVGVGLAGFFVCEADDIQARANFVEAVALDRLDELAFNRESPLVLEDDDMSGVTDASAAAVLVVAE